MGFSLKAIDWHGGERDESLSVSNRVMAELRALIGSATPSQPDTLAKLVVNDGQRVAPAECDELVQALRALDRTALAERDPEPARLLQLIDELARFCEHCAALGGFEVW